MRAYTVEYKEYQAGKVKSISILAKDKCDAWRRVVYDILDAPPYSAWVASVTYQNGNYKTFNNFEGKPY